MKRFDGLIGLTVLALICLISAEHFEVYKILWMAFGFQIGLITAVIIIEVRPISYK